MLTSNFFNISCNTLSETKSLYLPFIILMELSMRWWCCWCRRCCCYCCSCRWRSVSVKRGWFAAELFGWRESSSAPDSADNANDRTNIGRSASSWITAEVTAVCCINHCNSHNDSQQMQTRNQKTNQTKLSFVKLKIDIRLNVHKCTLFSYCLLKDLKHSLIL